MQELRLVAVSEDGSYLVLASAGRGTRFTLPVDDRLRAAIRGHFSRLGQFEIEVESPLRPKEIQARIRAGETAEEIAESAGIPVERVRWFEGPVLQEREYMAQQAQRCVVRAPGESTPGPPLGELVEERLGRRGADLEEVTWDAWKCEDNSWQIRLSFYDGGRPHAAEWKFDPRRRVARALDDEASRLSSLTEEEAPAPDTVTPLRRPAMKIVSDQRRDYPAGRPFAPAPPAATPLNPEPFTPERFQREARAADFPDLEALSALLEGGEPTVLPPPPGREPGEAPASRASAITFNPSVPREPDTPPAEAPAADVPSFEAPTFEAPTFEAPAEAAAPRPADTEPAASAERSPAPQPAVPQEPAPQAADDAREHDAAVHDVQAHDIPAPRPSVEAGPPVSAKADPAAAADSAEAPAASVGGSAPEAGASAPPERPVPERPASAEQDGRPVSDRPAASTAPERPARPQDAPAAPAATGPDPAAPEQPAPRPAAPAEPAAAQEPPPAEAPPAAQQPAPAPEPHREPPKPKPVPKPAPKPAPVPAAAAVPAKAEPRPRKRPARSRRASVPSWDEIMFGARRPD
ncbi:septation protein SepH [Actinocorallia populi]|uniref:septation protein SepH n=1 Tax=Actinocorallia populi TaxID=2079200 RepID=UPI000D094A27|nr:septation protein SepH [Actinocorallia populi]